MGYTINSILYGRRAFKYVELDTGYIGDCVLSKDLNKTRLHGEIKSVNYHNRIGKTLVFASDLAENCKVEYDNEKARYYMNSIEFDTLMKNNLLEKLLISKAEKWVLYIFIINVILLIMLTYTVYELRGMGNTIDYIAQMVTPETVEIVK